MAVIPVIDVGRFIDWGKEAVKEGVKWTLTRALLITVIMAVVPLAVFQAWIWITKVIVDAAGAAGSGAWSGQTIQYAGLAAWLAGCLRLPECLAAILSAASIAFTLRMIK